MPEGTPTGASSTTGQPTPPASGPTPARGGLALNRLGGAAALMMAAVLASRVIGYVRQAYIAWAFGASPQTDAYNVAFTIPNWLNYLVAGGALSITFITIFSPYLARGEEREGYRVFSIVATFMAVALTAGVILGEIFAPQLLRLYMPGFSAEQLVLCVRMTRILLPAQLFFGVGGLICATLYARGVFWLPALAPLFYSTSIIFGGVLLSHWLGITSLAVGALVGAGIGPFLFPLFGAKRGGLGFHFDFHFRDPAFVHWLKLTLPLMIGVSLVSADDWIMQPLSATFHGAITELVYAKQLMRAPTAVLGQAVGQATMPFFAWLVAENRWDELRETLDRAVVKTATAAVLATSYLAALALPLTELVYLRGRLDLAAARWTALYLTIFVISLAFWAVQGLYSRAFYAAGDTLTPMVAGTIVTAAMIPIYILLAHRFAVPGLAIASDTGMIIYTLVLAGLLHRRHWLGASMARWRVMPRVILVAVLAGGAAFGVARYFEPAHYAGLPVLGLVVAASVVWLALVIGLARLLGLRPLLDEAWRLGRRAWAKITPRAAAAS
ncbi:MAG: murein biosynthesis integral membrane protein MurJ [Terriglobales bacterium]